jgi:uncharacterized membrane protein YedE/YeeE
MAPFYKFDLFGEQTGFVIALALGIGFGFALERAGFAESRKLALQFYLRESVVLKTMFSAILTAGLGLTLFSWLGWIDYSRIYISPTFVGAQALGGLMLGIGMVIGGFCPGTSIVGSVVGRIDAWVFLGGALLGMFIFGESFPLLEDFFYANALGKMTLMEYFNLPMGVIASLMVAMALFMFLGAEYFERKFGEKE